MTEKQKVRFLRGWCKELGLVLEQGSDKRHWFVMCDEAILALVENCSTTQTLAFMVDIEDNDEGLS